MIVLLVGLGLTGLPGRRLLRSAWTATHPQAALLLWQLVLPAGLSGALWLGVMTVVSIQHLQLDLGHLLHACLVGITVSLEHRSAPLISLVGFLAALALGRLAVVLFRQTRSARRLRRAQRELLDLVGIPDASDPAVMRVLPGEQPVAYCLSGDGGRIVLSTAVARLLDDHELQAVVAHERAHLASRHHLLLLPARRRGVAAAGQRRRCSARAGAGCRAAG